MAGREREQDLLRKALATITVEREKYSPLRDGPPQIVKIVGPRGVGKTALLSWAQREVGPLEADVVHWAHLKNVNSEDAYSELLAAVARIPNWDRRQVETQAFKHIKRALNWQPGKKPLKGFKEIMEERLRLRPLMLLMDEVMHYDAGMLGKVLQQSQVLLEEGWPLALVLAGTPALEAHLGELDASFVYRTNNIYINDLDPAATREALSKPFADRGVKVSEEALELMVSWTDDYPYFIQITGSEVWEAKEKAGRTEVDLALVKSVEEIVQDKRKDFYRTIYRRISKAKLLKHARKAVAAIDAAPKPLKPEEVQDRMAEVTSLKNKDPSDIYDQLQDAGLFWERSDRRVHAAIPSFFSYFKSEYD